VSHSPLYRGNGYLPFCSECVDKMYKDYCSQFDEERDAVRHMCMKMDLYWSEDVWKMAELATGSMSKMRAYIGKCNLVRFIDKTFDDTLRDEAEANINANIPITETEALPEPEPEPVVEQRIIEFWGPGYTYDFYEELERRYSEWTDGGEVEDPARRSLYKQICLLETTIARDGAQGKAIDKNINQLNALLGSMNLKPAQQTDTGDAGMENTPFGVWIRRWENERPVPKVDPELEDVDGIIRYISIWFLGHLCSMLNIKNTYCKLYEEEIARRRIERPEFDDEDDEAFFNDIFESGGDDP